MNDHVLAGSGLGARNTHVNKYRGVGLIQQLTQDGGAGSRGGAAGLQQPGSIRSTVCQLLCDREHPCPLLVVVSLVGTIRGQDRSSPPSLAPSQLHCGHCEQAMPQRG